MLKVEEISTRVLGCSKAIEEYLKSNCSNTIPNKHLYIVLSISDMTDSSDFRSLIQWANDQAESLSHDELCSLIYEAQCVLSWVDLIPFKLDSNYIYSIVKLIPHGKHQDVRFHATFMRYHHYPTGKDKYDFNYFNQINDEDYKAKEDLWSREMLKKIKKHPYYGKLHMR